jgi:hypothetical protein
MAVPVGPVGSQERGQVELVDHVQHEPRQMVAGQPVAQVRREQEGLVAVAAQEVVGHGPSYPFAPLAPNIWVLKSQLRAATSSTLLGGGRLNPPKDRS